MADPVTKSDALAMQRFRKAVEAGDVDAVIASLADDVVFSSPVVFAPYRGRAAVGGILRCVMRVFQDFRYTDELHSDSQSVLVFQARVDDRELQGIDLITTNADGLIASLTVMVRPMSGATALANAMKLELAAMMRSPS
jgi:limonene-1,2-epoxide hydrolase